MKIHRGDPTSEGSLTITLRPQKRHVSVSVAVRGRPNSTLMLGVPNCIATTTLLDFAAVATRVSIGEMKERVVQEMDGWGTVHGVTVMLDDAGNAELSYQAPVADAFSPRRRGPSYDLRGTSRGFAAALMGFVALPWVSRGVWDASLQWDLPEGGVGESTRGRGACSWAGTTFDIGAVFVSGGELEVWDGDEGFSATWFEPQDYDTVEAFNFATSVLVELRRIFEPESWRAYHLLIRPSSIFRDGGAATTGGFMLESGRNSPTRFGRMFMFAHEIAHHFAATLHGDLSSVAWYSEGLAEFYKIEIPRRLGLCSSDALASEINTMTRAYAANLANRRSVAEIAGGHWTDSWVQGLPYNRGFHYFVGLNSLLREADKTIDDLVLEVNHRRAAGEELGNATWRSMLDALGRPRLIEHFDAMLAGDLLELDDDTFGNELGRRKITLNRRSIGFNDMTLTPLPATISGVEPGSAAHDAGLRDGDLVTGYTGASHSNLHSTAGLVLDETVTITVERDGVANDVIYETLIDTVDAWVWEPRVQRTS